MTPFTTTAFWRDTAVRATKTFAQSAVALLAAQATGLLDVDWLNLASVSGLAALLSVLTSIASGDNVGNFQPAAPAPAPDPAPEVTD